MAVPKPPCWALLATQLCQAGQGVLGVRVTQYPRSCFFIPPPPPLCPCMGPPLLALSLARAQQFSLESPSLQPALHVSRYPIKIRPHSVSGVPQLKPLSFASQALFALTCWLAHSWTSLLPYSHANSYCTFKAHSSVPRLHYPLLAFLCLDPVRAGACHTPGSPLPNPPRAPLTSRPLCLHSARLKNNNRQVCIDPKLKWIQEYLEKALNK